VDNGQLLSVGPSTTPWLSRVENYQKVLLLYWRPALQKQTMFLFQFSKMSIVISQNSHKDIQFATACNTYFDI